MTKQIHIVNGDSAAGCFKKAFSPAPDEILIFRDVLSCGPLKAFSDMESWMDYREKFWNGICIDELGSFYEWSRDFYGNVLALQSVDEVSLWLGTALSDQLMLVFVVKMFQHYDLDYSTIQVFQYTKLENQDLSALGLGLLNPESIKRLCPKPSQLTQQQVRFCLDVWLAITDSTPKALLNLLERNETCLPLLSRALKILCYRYPDRETGLSRFDENILRISNEKGPNAASVVGHVIAYDYHLTGFASIYELDVVGDVYLYSRLQSMASPKLNAPLLKLNKIHQEVLETTVTLTEFGLQVLAGKANAIDINGIDDWVCGVHLNSTDNNVWLRDNSHLYLKE
jgi:hypothetical protein